MLQPGFDLDTIRSLSPGDRQRLGGRVVKMRTLRQLFEEWGAANVETFIASGNVVFDSSRRSAAVAERAIEDHMGKALGYPVVTFLRTLSELATVAGQTLSRKSEYDAGATLFVGFMKDSPGRRRCPEQWPRSATT